MAQADFANRFGVSGESEDVKKRYAVGSPVGNRTPLAGAKENMADDAHLGGVPRSETSAEIMTDRAKQRASATGKSRHNQKLHGRPLRRGHAL